MKKIFSLVLFWSPAPSGAGRRNKPLPYLLLLVESGLLFLPFRFVLAVNELKPQGFVNDFANLLSSQAHITIEQDLQKFEKQTTAEISLAIIDSLDGDTIENKAVAMFKEWGIGKKGKDNGVLLLIARQDREARIEVGYGLEPYITDGRAGEIIRNDIIQNFRNENYDEGVKEAVKDIEGYIIEAQPETSQEVVRRSIRSIILQIFATQFSFLLFIFFLLYIANFLARSKSIWLGGVLGGFLGIFFGWLYISLLTGFILTPFLVGFGLLLDYILSRNYQTRKRTGLPTSFWITGGGFRGGNGGGFGGFGGGSSGGGGASGRW